jgi:hypothetical protein
MYGRTFGFSVFFPVSLSAASDHGDGALDLQHRIGAHLCLDLTLDADHHALDGLASAKTSGQGEGGRR